MGVCFAIINFNSGKNGILKIYEKLGMTSGYYTRQFCSKKDSKRVQKMEIKTKTVDKEGISS